MVCYRFLLHTNPVLNVHCMTSLFLLASVATTVRTLVLMTPTHPTIMWKLLLMPLTQSMTQ